MPLTIHHNNNYPYRLYASEAVLSLDEWIKKHNLPLQVHVNVVSPDFWLSDTQLASIGRVVSWEVEGMDKVPNKDKEVFDSRVQLVLIVGRSSSSTYRLPKGFKASIGGRAECLIPPLTFSPVHQQIEIPRRYFPRSGFDMAFLLLRQLDPKIQREDVAKLGTSGWYNPRLVEARLVPQPELYPEAFGNDVSVMDGEREYYHLQLSCLDSDLDVNLPLIITALKELASDLLPL